MDLFDWISKKVDKQAALIQQAEKDRLEAKKKWLANPFGMDPELQKRLVAEATKKREDEIGSQLSQMPRLFDPQRDYEMKLANYNARKAREEAEQKKRDKEFETKRRQRIAEQRSQSTVPKAKAPLRPNSAASNNQAPVIKGNVIPGFVVKAPSTAPITTPTFAYADLSPDDTVGAALAKIKAIQTLADLVPQEHTKPQRIVYSATPVVFETPNPVPGSLSFLRNDPGFLEIREAIHQNPELLLPFIEKIKQENPPLAQFLYHNEDEFQGLLAEKPNSVTELPVHLQFLEHDTKLASLRRKVQRRPERLGWAMRKLVEENPGQAAIIACNESHFIEWLNVGSSVRIEPVAKVVSLHPSLDIVGESSTPMDCDLSTNLDFLRSNIEFLKIRATYQARPEMLKWLAGKFIAGNPELKEVITNNEAEFIQLMDEGFVPPPEVASHRDEEEIDDEDCLSPLSERIIQAEQNADLNIGTTVRKTVRFTDSTIRADNNMDLSPLRNVEIICPVIQDNTVQSNHADGYESSWPAFPVESTSSIPDLGSSSTAMNQSHQGFGADLAHSNSSNLGMFDTPYSGMFGGSNSTTNLDAPRGKKRKSELDFNDPIVPPESNVSSPSKIDIFAPNPMFKPAFDPTTNSQSSDAVPKCKRYRTRARIPGDTTTGR